MRPGRVLHVCEPNWSPVASGVFLSSLLHACLPLSPHMFMFASIVAAGTFFYLVAARVFCFRIRSLPRVFSFVLTCCRKSFLRPLGTIGDPSVVIADPVWDKRGPRGKRGSTCNRGPHSERAGFPLGQAGNLCGTHGNRVKNRAAEPLYYRAQRGIWFSYVTPHLTAPLTHSLTH